MSLYKKPARMRYTDMCIYIDNNAYREDLTAEEESTIYEYLYHIAKMLAYKAKYFNRHEYYDDFAVYFATFMYLRYKNPKQYQIDEETGEPKLEKIRGVLNYMKNVIYMRKYEFEQEEYSQVLSQQSEDDAVEYNTEYSFADKLSSTTDDISSLDFDLCLGNICDTTKGFLKQIPYKRGTVVWNNIYLSCLLTLLNMFTLSNRTKIRIKSFTYDVGSKLSTIKNSLDSTPEDSVILYHLDKNMRDYIWVLVQEIKNLLAKDLSLSTRTYIPHSDMLNMVALADINLEEYTNYGE